MSRHFPFNPRTPRRIFWLIAFGSLVPFGQALQAVRGGQGLPGYVRAGMCVGILGASALVAWGLRPRDGWGVTVHAAGMLLGRPPPAAPVEVPWEKVELAPRPMQGVADVVLHDESGKRLVLKPSLFGKRTEFLALTQAVEEHLPPSRTDA